MGPASTFSATRWPVVATGAVSLVSLEHARSARRRLSQFRPRALEWAGPMVFPATATQLLIADLCGTGLGLTFSRPGDPATWAYPIWGPDAPWEN
jgi:hypothetical protein